MPTDFELDPSLIHLNHAAVAPWPTCVREAVNAFTAENAQWGSRNYPHWIQVETELRQRLAQLINVPVPDDIALLKNTSEALSVVAHGLDWQDGDQVVISDQEFPSNRIVWESLAAAGVTVSQVSLTAAESPEQALIQACNARTRLLAISSVQYASGLRVNLIKLGQFCREHGILFCVDAIQSIGALTTDVQAMQADFIMADGHKWMLGPEGLALFYARPAAREQLTLHQFGWHMIEAYGEFDKRDWEIAHSARRFECGSPNMLGVHALHASVGLLLDHGMGTIQKAVLRNSETLFELIEASTNLECLTNTHPDRYAGIVVFRHKNLASETLYTHLMQHNVLCAQRGGGIRFSPHYYTEPEKIAEAISLADQCPSV
ncbi:MAG: aminotransferase class V-fold PLP-dependent enzyme [Proteobacteria bacterium]|jgi:selenocysteine lyase/cysteine desulfurase|nr:aminotransferase class V-fold PLP-dependent enzyme [Pseudomonadota bacterium]